MLEIDTPSRLILHWKRLSIGKMFLFVVSFEEIIGQLLRKIGKGEQTLAMLEECQGQVGDVTTGVVQRVDSKGVFLDLGKCEAFVPPSEQIEGESFNRGQKVKVFLLEKLATSAGERFVASRTHKDLLGRLLEQEVLEIQQGIVLIKSIAREPGSRSKVAVATQQEGVDPVGCCVGQRGSRIQRIVRELGGERIDVVAWASDIATFITNAVSPAQAVVVVLRRHDNTAEVAVPDRQISLAIGADGQNARLAAKLTGWRVDIKPASLVKAVQQSIHRAKPADELPAPPSELPSAPNQ